MKGKFGESIVPFFLRNYIKSFVLLFSNPIQNRGEMFDYIVAQKRVPELQACKFFHQIIDGIEVLHRNEITHRDLKPEVSCISVV